MTATRAHWHVATGLAGYGPEGSDGYGTATDARVLADLIREELDNAASAATDTANSLADDGQYADAWKEKTRAEGMGTLALNFHNRRADAPLYRGKPELWAETVERMAVEHFPYDISHNTRLYVWDCMDPSCEHLADLDD